MELLFATGNPHKVTEVQYLLPKEIKIRTLHEIGINEEIPETGKTLEENALQKAEYVKKRIKGNVFAEDTGLEVKVLHNAPGVYSARYAGPQHDSRANLLKLLKEMEGQKDRTARFRTVIALILNDEIHRFEGIVNGRIAEKASGKGGFGYDPVFIPEGFDRSFAELGDAVKSRISHRAQAMKKMISFLNTLRIQP